MDWNEFLSAAQKSELCGVNKPNNSTRIVNCLEGTVEQRYSGQNVKLPSPGWPLFSQLPCVDSLRLTLALHDASKLKCSSHLRNKSYSFYISISWSLGEGLCYFILQYIFNTDYISYFLFVWTVLLHFHDRSILKQRNRTTWPSG